MYNNILLLISSHHPNIYRNMQLASKSFWIHLNSLTETKEKIRRSFISYEFGDTTFTVNLKNKSRYGVLPNGKREGLCEAWHDNGSLASRHYYKNGKLDGSFIYWYDNGPPSNAEILPANIYAEGQYSEGKLVGLWTNYHNNGSIWSIDTYIDDKKDGICYLLSRDGVSDLRERYRTGVRHGLSEYYCNNYYHRLYYVNNIADGVAEVWNSRRYMNILLKNNRMLAFEVWTLEGILMYRVTYRNGNTMVLNTYFRIEDYIWHIDDGTIETFHPNGKIATIRSYSGRKLNGLFERWTTKGTILEKSEYFNGKLIESHYRNKVLKIKNNYQDNKLNNTSYSFYPNGELESRVNYSNDLKNGISESWYRSGKIRNRGTYRNGELEGLYESWYPNGQLASRVNYAAGVKLKVECWFQDGSINPRIKKIKPKPTVGIVQPEV